jgi:hypothetical protein
MLRSGQIKRRLLVVSGLCAVAVVTATGGLTAAAAAAGTGPARPSAPAAPATAQEHTYTATYACDLSDYGYTGPAVDVSATVGFNTPVDATPGFGALYFDHGLYMWMSTGLATLPTSVADQLTNLSFMGVRATLPVGGSPTASPTTVFAGGSFGEIFMGPLTQLPGTLGTGTVWLSRPGTAWLNVLPRSLVFTPYGQVQPSLPMPSITCTTAPTSILTVKIAVGGQAIRAPFYSCVSTYRTSTYRTPLPMAITVSGVRSVGHTVSITLSSPETGLAAPAGNDATELKFTGSLRVRGAQQGQIGLNETTKNTGAATFRVAGRLRLTRSGTDWIYFPQRFVYTVLVPNLKAAVYTCSLATTPAPVALTLKVAR